MFKILGDRRVKQFYIRFSIWFLMKQYISYITRTKQINSLYIWKLDALYIVLEYKNCDMY